VNAWLKTAVPLQGLSPRQFEREKTRDAREKFIDIQAAIEAIDRAIEDEDGQVTT
jgi:hypothetical protein